MTGLITPILVMWLLVQAKAPIWVEVIYLALILADVVTGAYKAGKGDKE